MAVIDWWNGPLTLVVIFFALCLLLLTWSIACVACRVCHSSGTLFFIVTHTHTHTHTLSLSLPLPPPPPLSLPSLSVVLFPTLSPFYQQSCIMKWKDSQQVLSTFHAAKSGIFFWTSTDKTGLRADSGKERNVCLKYVCIFCNLIFQGQGRSSPK